MEIIDTSDTLPNETVRKVITKIVNLARIQAKEHTPDLNLWAETWNILAKERCFDIVSDNEMHKRKD